MTTKSVHENVSVLRKRLEGGASAAECREALDTLKESIAKSVRALDARIDRMGVEIKHLNEECDETDEIFAKIMEHAKL